MTELHLKSIGAKLTLAQRLNRDSARVGICEHSSNAFDVIETDKVEIPKVAVGGLLLETQLDGVTYYKDGQMIYNQGLLYLVSTIPTSIVGSNRGRDLFLVQGLETNARELGDWAQDF